MTGVLVCAGKPAVRSGYAGIHFPAGPIDFSNARIRKNEP
jgi:hypothetical protein